MLSLYHFSFIWYVSVPCETKSNTFNTSWCLKFSTSRRVHLLKLIYTHVKITNCSKSSVAAKIDLPSTQYPKAYLWTVLVWWVWELGTHNPTVHIWSNNQSCYITMISQKSENRCWYVITASAQKFYEPIKEPSIKLSVICCLFHEICQFFFFFFFFLAFWKTGPRGSLVLKIFKKIWTWFFDFQISHFCWGQKNHQKVTLIQFSGKTPFPLFVFKTEPSNLACFWGNVSSQVCLLATVLMVLCQSV